MGPGILQADWWMWFCAVTPPAPLNVHRKALAWLFLPPCCQLSSGWSCSRWLQTPRALILPAGRAGA